MKTIYRTVLQSALYSVSLFPLHAVAEDVPGAKAGDDVMTCEQIAAELAPYANQMSGTVNPLVQTQSELEARNEKRMAAAVPEAAALTAAATASHLDPTGMAGRAVGQAEIATQQRIWNQSMAEDKPLMDQENQQMNAMMKQAMAMQANPRLQRLMQLAQQKNCH